MNFLNLLFYSYCLVCSEKSDCEICDKCKNSFIERKNKERVFPEIRVYSWGMYEGDLRNAILALKNGHKKLSKPLGSILSNLYNQYFLADSFCAIIPVPCSKTRIVRRGFCQTDLLALEIFKNTNIQIDTKYIARVKSTKFMNTLNDLESRQKNIKNAFEVIAETKEQQNYRNILLVDDILTSGTTMIEIVRTIKMSFPSINIVGITIASGDKG